MEIDENKDHDYGYLLGVSALLKVFYKLPEWGEAVGNARQDLIRLNRENTQLRKALKETLEIASRNETGDYIKRAHDALGD